MKTERIDSQRPADLVSAVRTGNRTVLARTITLLESTRPSDRHLASTVLRHGSATPKLRIGVTGPPGVGKSTFIDALGSFLTDRKHRVAVLAIDPSSPRTSGSILGDKTRMPRLANSDLAFIRPTPSGNTSGGIAATTLDTARLCEMAGYEYVLIETVGSGQAALAIRAVADIIVLLVQPGAGDELQSIKRGILDLADLILVTKADGDGEKAATSTRSMFRRAWSARPVEICSGLTGAGTPLAWQRIDAIYQEMQSSGELTTRRKESAAEAVAQALTEILLEDCLADDRAISALQAAEYSVAAGRISCFEAAIKVLDAYRHE